LLGAQCSQGGADVAVRAGVSAVAVGCAQGPDLARGAEVDRLCRRAHARAQLVDEGGQPHVFIAWCDEDVGATIGTARRPDQAPQVLAAAPAGQLLGGRVTTFADEVDVDDAQVRTQPPDHGGHLAFTDKGEPSLERGDPDALDVLVVRVNGEPPRRSEHQLVEVAKGCSVGDTPTPDSNGVIAIVGAACYSRQRKATSSPA
jgi:hypothetical protein